MKHLVLIIAGLCCSISTLFSQGITQTVRGTILDTDSKSPIVGAQVVVLDMAGGAITDIKGTFKIENVPVGNINLQLSYLGYEKQIIPNIVVNAGKEVVLDLYMQESLVRMNEVVINAVENKGDAVNEMSILSARSISLEETKRYAGGFNDPSRILSSFAGISNSQNGDNDIIVRGNSPKYIQWRLEGIEITNPNHFADQNSISGGISALNNNLLATSDFQTGAFSPEYGDVLSGVFDVNLRAGNNEKFESSFGLGILGTDLMVEGPFKKGYNGSYLFNYRYSTISLINEIGLVNVGGIPSFQDMAFKVTLPTKKIGNFSLFGLGGLSSVLFEDVGPQIWNTPGDDGMQENLQEDFDKTSYLLNTGLNHTISINDQSFIKTSLSYSGNGTADQVFESNTLPIYDGNGNILRDSIINRRLNFKSDLKKTTYRAAITYNNKVNTKNKIQAGIKYALFDYDFEQSNLSPDRTTRFTFLDFNENIGTFRSFVSWKHRFNKALTIVGGVHNMNVLYNKKSTIEPRIAFNWKWSNTSTVHAGYGKHSTMESVHHYFAKIQQPNGSTVEPNKDLDVLKAHHFVIGYEKRFTPQIRAKVELYYQHLYNLPVENLDTSYFSTINEGLEYRYVDLVNKGTGENYGVEVTLERFLHRNFYFLLNGSLFNSTYTSLEGIERNTAFNAQYLVNFLAGKEFLHLGKKKNKSISLNGKIFYGGGRKYIPLLRDSEGQLNIDPLNGRFWDYTKAYEDKIDDNFQMTFSVSYKIQKKSRTHEIYLNIDNLTNTKSRLSEFYDDRAPGSIGYTTQFGVFPNLIYRIYF